jgi:hypothetical protein
MLPSSWSLLDETHHDEDGSDNQEHNGHAISFRRVGHAPVTSVPSRCFVLFVGASENETSGHKAQDSKNHQD